MALAQPTQTSIYNRALALLGSVNRVENENDGKAVTDTLNEHWPQAVRELLAEHPWNCAIRRATLNRGNAPVHGEGYTYKLPADCLRWLPATPDQDDYWPAVQEGSFLVCDGPAQLNIRYIGLVEDVSSWPPHLVSVMAYRLAYDAAEAITQSASVTEKRRIAYEGQAGDGGQLAKAKGIDGLATGDRERGNVVTRSRALGAAYTRRHYAPGR